MTFEYFKNTIELVISMFEEKREFEGKLEKVFGGDTQIISDLLTIKIEKILENLATELKDQEEWIDYLVFEVLMSPIQDPKDYIITLTTGEELIANIENIWFILTGERIK